MEMAEIFDKLQAVADRYDELNELISDIRLKEHFDDNSIKSANFWHFMFLLVIICLISKIGNHDFLDRL